MSNLFSTLTGSNPSTPSYRSTFDTSPSQFGVSDPRQLSHIIDQGTRLSGATGFFANYYADARTNIGGDVNTVFKSLEKSRDLEVYLSGGMLNAVKGDSLHEGNLKSIKLLNQGRSQDRAFLAGNNDLLETAGAKEFSQHGKILSYRLDSGEYFTRIDTAAVGTAGLERLGRTDFFYQTTNPEIGKEAWDYRASISKGKRPKSGDYLLTSKKDTYSKLLKDLNNSKGDVLIHSATLDLETSDIFQKLIEIKHQGRNVTVLSGGGRDTDKALSYLNSQGITTGTPKYLAGSNIPLFVFNLLKPFGINPGALGASEHFNYASLTLKDSNVPVVYLGTSRLTAGDGSVESTLRITGKEDPNLKREMDKIVKSRYALIENPTPKAMMAFGLGFQYQLEQNIIDSNPKSIQAYSDESVIPYYPIDLASVRKVYGLNEPLPYVQLYEDLYNQRTGRAAPWRVKQLDRAMNTNLGLEYLNRMTGLPIYHQGRGLIGSTLSNLGKGIDDLFGRQAYLEFKHEKRHPSKGSIRTLLGIDYTPSKPEEDPGIFESILNTSYDLMSGTAISIGTYLGINLPLTHLRAYASQTSLETLLAPSADLSKAGQVVRSSIQKLVFGEAFGEALAYATRSSATPTEVSTNLTNVLVKLHDMQRAADPLTYLENLDDAVDDNVEVKKTLRKFLKQTDEGVTQVLRLKGFGALKDAPSQVVLGETDESSVFKLIHAFRVFDAERFRNLGRPILEAINPYSIGGTGYSPDLYSIYRVSIDEMEHTFRQMPTLIYKTPGASIADADVISLKFKNIGQSRVTEVAKSLDRLGALLPVNFAYWIPGVREGLGLTDFNPRDNLNWRDILSLEEVSTSVQHSISGLSSAFGLHWQSLPPSTKFRGLLDKRLREFALTLGQSVKTIGSSLRTGAQMFSLGQIVQTKSNVLMKTLNALALEHGDDVVGLRGALTGLISDVPVQISGLDPKTGKPFKPTANVFYDYLLNRKELNDVYSAYSAKTQISQIPIVDNPLSEVVTSKTHHHKQFQNLGAERFVTKSIDPAYLRKQAIGKGVRLVGAIALTDLALDWAFYGGKVDLVSQVLGRSALFSKEKVGDKEEDKIVARFKFENNVPKVFSLGFGLAGAATGSLLFPRITTSSVNVFLGAEAKLGLSPAQGQVFEEVLGDIKLTKYQFNVKGAWAGFLIGLLLAKSFGAVATVGLNALYGNKDALKLNTEKAVLNDLLNKKAVESLDKAASKFGVSEDYVTAALLETIAQSNLQAGKYEDRIYNLATQFTLPFFQVSGVGKISTRDNTFSMGVGFQLAPITGLGLSPMLPFSLALGKPDLALFEKLESESRDLNLAESSMMIGKTATALLLGGENLVYNKESGFRDAMGLMGTLGLISSLTSRPRQAALVRSIPNRAMRSQVLREINTIKDLTNRGWGKTIGALSVNAVRNVNTLPFFAIAATYKSIKVPQLGAIVGGAILLSSTIQLAETLQASFNLYMLGRATQSQQQLKPGEFPSESTIYGNYLKTGIIAGGAVIGLGFAPQISSYMTRTNAMRTFAPYYLGFTMARLLASPSSDFNGYQVQSTSEQVQATIGLGFSMGFLLHSSGAFATASQLQKAYLGRTSRTEIKSLLKSSYRLSNEATEGLMGFYARYKETFGSQPTFSGFFSRLGLEDAVLGDVYSNLQIRMFSPDNVTARHHPLPHFPTENSFRAMRGRVTLGASALVGGYALATALMDLSPTRLSNFLAKVPILGASLKVITGYDNSKAYDSPKPSLGRWLSRFLPSSLVDQIGLYSDKPDPFLQTTSTFGKSFKETGTKDYFQMASDLTDLSASSYVLAQAPLGLDAKRLKLIQSNMNKSAKGLLQVYRGLTPRRTPATSSSISSYNLGAVSSLGVLDLRLREFKEKSVRNQSVEELQLDLSSDLLRSGHRRHPMMTKQRGTLYNPLFSLFKGSKSLKWYTQERGKDKYTFKRKTIELEATDPIITIDNFLSGSLYRDKLLYKAFGGSDILSNIFSYLSSSNSALGVASVVLGGALVLGVTAFSGAEMLTSLAYAGRARSAADLLEEQTTVASMLSEKRYSFDAIEVNSVHRLVHLDAVSRRRSGVIVAGLNLDEVTHRIKTVYPNLTIANPDLVISPKTLAANIQVAHRNLISQVSSFYTNELVSPINDIATLDFKGLDESEVLSLRQGILNKHRVSLRNALRQRLIYALNSEIIESVPDFTLTQIYDSGRPTPALTVANRLMGNPLGDPAMVGDVIDNLLDDLLDTQIAQSWENRFDPEFARKQRIRLAEARLGSSARPFFARLLYPGGEAISDLEEIRYWGDQTSGLNTTLETLERQRRSRLYSTDLYPAKAWSQGLLRETGYIASASTRLLADWVMIGKPLYEMSEGLALGIRGETEVQRKEGYSSAIRSVADSLVAYGIMAGISILNLPSLVSLGVSVGVMLLYSSMRLKSTQSINQEKRLYDSVASYMVDPSGFLGAKWGRGGEALGTGIEWAMAIPMGILSGLVMPFQYLSSEVAAPFIMSQYSDMEDDWGAVAVAKGFLLPISAYSPDWSRRANNASYIKNSLERAATSSYITTVHPNLLGQSSTVQDEVLRSRYFKSYSGGVRALSSFNESYSRPSNLVQMDLARKQGMHNQAVTGSMVNRLYEKPLDLRAALFSLSGLIAIPLVLNRMRKSSHIGDLLNDLEYVTSKTSARLGQFMFGSNYAATRQARELLLEVGDSGTMPKIVLNIDSAFSSFNYGTNTIRLGFKDAQVLAKLNRGQRVTAASLSATNFNVLHEYYHSELVNPLQASNVVAIPNRKNGYDPLDYPRPLSSPKGQFFDAQIRQNRLLAYPTGRTFFTDSVDDLEELGRIRRIRRTIAALSQKSVIKTVADLRQAGISISKGQMTELYLEEVRVNTKAYATSLWAGNRHNIQSIESSILSDDQIKRINKKYKQFFRYTAGRSSIPLTEVYSTASDPKFKSNSTLRSIFADSHRFYKSRQLKDINVTPSADYFLNYKNTIGFQWNQAWREFGDTLAKPPSLLPDLEPNASGFKHIRHSLVNLTKALGLENLGKAIATGSSRIPVIALLDTIFTTSEIVGGMGVQGSMSQQGRTLPNRVKKGHLTAKFAKRELHAHRQLETSVLFASILSFATPFITRNLLTSISLGVGAMWYGSKDPTYFGLTSKMDKLDEKSLQRGEYISPLSSTASLYARLNLDYGAQAAPTSYLFKTLKRKVSNFAAPFFKSKGLAKFAWLASYNSYSVLASATTLGLSLAEKSSLHSQWKNLSNQEKAKYNYEFDKFYVMRQSKGLQTVNAVAMANLFAVGADVGTQLFRKDSVGKFFTKGWVRKTLRVGGWLGKQALKLTFGLPVALARYGVIPVTAFVFKQVGRLANWGVGGVLKMFHSPKPKPDPAWTELVNSPNPIRLLYARTKKAVGKGAKWLIAKGDEYLAKPVSIAFGWTVKQLGRAYNFVETIPFKLYGVTVKPLAFATFGSDWFKSFKGVVKPIWDNSVGKVLSAIAKGAKWVVKTTGKVTGSVTGAVTKTLISSPNSIAHGVGNRLLREGFRNVALDSLGYGLDVAQYAQGVKSITQLHAQSTVADYQAAYSTTYSAQGSFFGGLVGGGAFGFPGALIGSIIGSAVEGLIGYKLGGVRHEQRKTNILTDVLLPSGIQATVVAFLYPHLKKFKKKREAKLHSRLLQTTEEGLNLIENPIRKPRNIFERISATVDRSNLETLRSQRKQYRLRLQSIGRGYRPHDPVQTFLEDIETHINESTLDSNPIKAWTPDKTTVKPPTKPTTPTKPVWTTGTSNTPGVTAKSLGEAWTEPVKGQSQSATKLTTASQLGADLDIPFTSTSTRKLPDLWGDEIDTPLKPLGEATSPVNSTFRVSFDNTEVSFQSPLELQAEIEARQATLAVAKERATDLQQSLLRREARVTQAKVRAEALKVAIEQKQARLARAKVNGEAMQTAILEKEIKADIAKMNADALREAVSERKAIKLQAQVRAEAMRTAVLEKEIYAAIAEMNRAEIQANRQKLVTEEGILPKPRTKTDIQQRMDEIGKPKIKPLTPDQKNLSEPRVPPRANQSSKPRALDPLQEGEYPITSGRNFSKRQTPLQRGEKDYPDDKGHIILGQRPSKVPSNLTNVRELYRSSQRAFGTVLRLAEIPFTFLGLREGYLTEFSPEYGRSAVRRNLKNTNLEKSRAKQVESLSIATGLLTISFLTHNFWLSMGGGVGIFAYSTSKDPYGGLAKKVSDKDKLSDSPVNLAPSLGYYPRSFKKYDTVAGWTKATLGHGVAQIFKLIRPKRKIGGVAKAGKPMVSKALYLFDQLLGKGRGVLSRLPKLNLPFKGQVRSIFKSKVSQDLLGGWVKRGLFNPTLEILGLSFDVLQGVQASKELLDNPSESQAKQALYALIQARQSLAMGLGARGVFGDFGGLVGSTSYEGVNLGLWLSGSKTRVERVDEAWLSQTAELNDYQFSAILEYGVARGFQDYRSARLSALTTRSLIQLGYKSLIRPNTLRTGNALRSARLGLTATKPNLISQVFRRLDIGSKATLRSVKSTIRQEVLGRLRFATRLVPKATPGTISKSTARISRSQVAKAVIRTLPSVNLAVSLAESMVGLLVANSAFQEAKKAKTPAQFSLAEERAFRALYGSTASVTAAVGTSKAKGVAIIPAIGGQIIATEAGGALGTVKGKGIAKLAERENVSYRTLATQQQLALWASSLSHLVGQLATRGDAGVAVGQSGVSTSVTVASHLAIRTGKDTKDSNMIPLTSLTLKETGQIAWSNLIGNVHVAAYHISEAFKSPLEPVYEQTKPLDQYPKSMQYQIIRGREEMKQLKRNRERAHAPKTEGLFKELSRFFKGYDDYLEVDPALPSAKPLKRDKTPALQTQLKPTKVESISTSRKTFIRQAGQGYVKYKAESTKSAFSLKSVTTYLHNYFIRPIFDKPKKSQGQPSRNEGQAFQGQAYLKELTGSTSSYVVVGGRSVSDPKTALSGSVGSDSVLGSSASDKLNGIKSLRSKPAWGRNLSLSSYIKTEWEKLSWAQAWLRRMFMLDRLNTILKEDPKQVDPSPLNRLKRGVKDIVALPKNPTVRDKLKDVKDNVQNFYTNLYKRAFKPIPALPFKPVSIDLFKPDKNSPLGLKTAYSIGTYVTSSQLYSDFRKGLTTITTSKFSPISYTPLAKYLPSVVNVLPTPIPRPESMKSMPPEALTGTVVTPPVYKVQPSSAIQIKDKPLVVPKTLVTPKPQVMPKPQVVPKTQVMSKPLVTSKPQVVPKLQVGSIPQIKTFEELPVREEGYQGLRPMTLDIPYENEVSTDSRGTWTIPTQSDSGSVRPSGGNSSLARLTSPIKHKSRSQTNLTSPLTLPKGYSSLEGLAQRLVKSPYFDQSTTEGRVALAVALTIAGTEAFGKNSRDRNWFTKRGGTGSNYLGFAQMDMNLHKGKGIFKEESYIETIGKMIHGQISTPTSKGKINLAGLVQAVEQGQIKSGQDFEAYLRTYGRGNLDRLNPLNISTNDWHGLGPNSIGGGWSRVPGLSNALVGYIANPIPVTDTFERPAEEAVDFNKVFNLLSQDAQANSVQTKPIKTSGVLVYSVGGGGKVLKGSSTFADTRAHHGGKKDYTTQFGRVRDYDLGGTNVEGSNSPLRVAKPGQISYIGLRGGYGLVVELADSNGKPLARYAHLDSVPKGLKVGKSVTPGEVIGFEGTTSSSNGKLIRGAYGDHLHLEASPDYHTAWIKGTVTGTWQGGTTSAYQMGQAITPSMANRLFELVGNLSPTDRLKLEQEIRVYNSNLDKPRAPSQAGTPKPVETTLGQDKPTSKPKPKFQSGMPDNRRRFRENPQEILNGNTVPQVITPKDLYNSSEGLDLSPALREQLQKPLERKSTKSMSNSVSIVLPSTEVSGGHEDTVYQVKPKEVSVARVTGKVIEVYSPTQYVTDSMDRVDTIPHNETYNDTH